jgi:NAD(P)-dependent dehydrogenase (short-subunit alcohol dehydrogenase family)
MTDDHNAALRALVTGAGGKLLRGVVPLLDERGWHIVAVASRDGNVATTAGAHAVVERAVGELGGLDVLVNGAGAGFRPIPFAEVTEADLDAALGATVKGSFLVTQAAAPHLRATHGVVVMIEDVAAFQPWPSFAAHCAAKAAQAMLTRVLAKALAPDIRVVGVAPGPVAVEPEQKERRARETALGRIGSPRDVAEAIAYVTGAGFVTGTSLIVDGGRLLQSGPSRHA